MKNTTKKIILTFDVEGPPHREDFINEEVLTALYYVLKLLKKYDFKGLFFITASAAEKISCYPKIIELLRIHEIGYHSSSHSVKPCIFEYTDVKSYEKAIETSIERETSCIDLFNGCIKGKGGILSLRQKFPEKEITSFRAPFLCWVPSHLEALRKLGLKFDFSSDISNLPVFHKGITFFPYPVVIDSMFSNFHVFLKKMWSEEFIVLLMHPSHAMFEMGESHYEQHNNPFIPVEIKKCTHLQTKFRFRELELLFLGLCLLQRKKLIQIKNSLEESEKSLDQKLVNVANVYEKSVWAPKNLFGYKPKYLLSHFHYFLKT